MMRSKFVGVVLGLGLLVAAAVPAVACPYHDQQASAAQQQTAQADQQSTTTAQ